MKMSIMTFLEMLSNGSEYSESGVLEQGRSIWCCSSCSARSGFSLSGSPAVTREYASSSVLAKGQLRKFFTWFFLGSGRASRFKLLTPVRCLSAGVSSLVRWGDDCLAFSFPGVSDSMLYMVLGLSSAGGEILGGWSVGAPLEGCCCKKLALCTLMAASTCWKMVLPCLVSNSKLPSPESHRLPASKENVVCGRPACYYHA